ncbi:cold-shock protein [Streptomyces spectabilis]|uniref:Cold shock domain-containing protein n=1 Tax=Streptomyces spectabilis TaxID=68270 RepID=A0A516RM35_STRST|nr:cold shock domain-containing protein [Streptomyces spectabilis]QDQ16714.1 cold shock domain-containing protein [Streptomyces spectabilis]
MLTVGKVLRFDEVRGYGFIAPETGDEDVFMHANDLVGEKYLYQEGSVVEFFLEMGDKGPKASNIRLVHQSTSHQLPRGGLAARAAAPAAGAGEVSPADEFTQELTEALLDSVGSLTGDQIKRVRACVLELAREHGWVAS